MKKICPSCKREYRSIENFHLLGRDWRKKKRIYYSNFPHPKRGENIENSIV